MLSLDNLSKSYGGRKILDRVSWSMADDGRVGLVGLNGAGKSTLLKMIAEVIPLDSGRITRPQRTRVGYLAQDAPEMGGRSVLRETLAALDRMQALDLRRKEVEQILAHEHRGPAHDAALEELGEVLTELERHEFYSAESRATSVLFGLGFTDEDLGRDVAEFSGGIRMRIALAKLLLDAPEFMMLDEPTNHLDIEARNWLEDFLCAYQGGIILVSHDRYFLDRVTTRTVEVSRGRLTEYAGGYSRYLVAREERFAARDGGVSRDSASRSSTWRVSSAASATRRAKRVWCKAASSNSTSSNASSRRKDRRSRPRFRFRNANGVRGGFSNSRARSNATAR